MEVGEDWERVLPPWVSAALAPHQRRALKSAVRRRILRTLSGLGYPATLPDLARRLGGGSSIGDIAYHVIILDECGCVTVSVRGQRDGGAWNGQPGRRGFAPNLVTKHAVKYALDATEALDALE